ncbi:DsbA family protein [Streptomyces sp. ET3-23]|uniref:DsbA family protein n=1 Tax=Streptomyces morookaense TaxID=1970 RepID=A0A7Y7B9A2_STRMO|nr:DsbA family protein [Streptomyces sp. ET3-23]NVK81342.1 DsbA family protein [Streptomyces morookaense]
MTNTASGVTVEPGTIVVFAEIASPWAHLAVHRLHETRRRLGLYERVLFDIRACPLELINGIPTPKLIIDSEVPVAAVMEPDAGWQLWQGPAHEWPVTTLPAMEAVEAAKDQGLRAGESLDRALRRSFFSESRTISMRHVILDVAASCPEVDADALRNTLGQGSARAAVERHLSVAQSDAVQGSPHLFLPDGTSAFNPGITWHWQGQPGRGFPVVDSDDPAVYERLLRQAASA